MSTPDEIDYDIYIKKIESAINELKSKYLNKEINYTWEIKLKKYFENYINLKISRDESLKLIYLKRGYPINIDGFFKLFSFN